MGSEGCNAHRVAVAMGTVVGVESVSMFYYANLQNVDSGSYAACTSISKRL